MECARCRYIVNDDEFLVDRDVLGFKPGDFICFSAGQRDRKYPLTFININGSSGNSIFIMNCGGIASVKVPDSFSFNLKFVRRKNFRVTGSGDSEEYGLELSGGTLA